MATITGTSGDDPLSSSGNDPFLPGDAQDVVYGSTGYDTVDYSDSSWVLTVSLPTGTTTGARTDDLYGIKAVLGSDYAALIYGDSQANFHTGKTGNDTLNGMTGDDLLYGGSGNDKLDGSDDDDTLYGSDGVHFVYGGAGNDGLYGGNDSGVDPMYGGDDIIDGGDGDDSLTGGTGEGLFVYADGDGTDTTIDFGPGDTITLLGVVESELHSDDFSFL